MQASHFLDVLAIVGSCRTGDTCVFVAKNKWVSPVYFDNYTHVMNTPCGENAEYFNVTTGST